MPVRLAVAVAVGAVALGLLLPMLEDVERSEPTTIRAELAPQQVVLDEVSDHQRLTITVRTDDGQPVTGAAVVVSGHSLPLVDGPAVLETGPDSNEVSVGVGRGRGADLQVDFRATQARGTLDVAVKPSPGERFRQGESPSITVIAPDK